ncbi:MAG: LacI family DNA-binding transcriptional regulator [Oscillospiraceae bacterium]|nr:LacI family DNA-binding transcriptional regulator [Oscillospiraceae bacterium]
MTIKDLSARTGYSVGTVSRVLNDQPNVSEKARKAILEAARESGFQLNTNAQQLKKQHTNSILVVVKGISNQLFASLVEAMQARIARTGHPLIVDYMDEEGNEVLHALRLCREKKPLGVLFLGGNRENFLADFDKIGRPCVLVTNDASDLAFPNLSSVCSDNRQAARAAIDALVELGHRQIAVIGGNLISDTTRLRFQGCMDAFQEHGITFDPEQDYEAVRFSYADGYWAARDLLDRGRSFSAIFAMSDVMAIGAIRALQDRGKRVPEDISVIGFDGLVIGEYTVPRLATVCQDVDALAIHSIHMLLDSIAHPGLPRHATVPVTVALRSSTGHAGDR